MAETAEHIGDTNMSQPTYIAPHEILESFDEYLNETYPWFTLAGYDTDVAPSQILKQFDMRTYRILLEKYMENEYESNTDWDTGEARYYLERGDE